MKEKNRWDSEGNYHDDDIRLESYAETADIIEEPVDNLLVETVVKKMSDELAPTIKQNPTISVKEIKIQAQYRFMDLLEKQLLKQQEADRCYQRFVQLVHYYYGS